MFGEDSHEVHFDLVRREREFEQHWDNVADFTGLREVASVRLYFVNHICLFVTIFYYIRIMQQN